jgi:hypothetical protein
MYSRTNHFYFNIQKDYLIKGCYEINSIKYLLWFIAIYKLCFSLQTLFPLVLKVERIS